MRRQVHIALIISLCLILALALTSSIQADGSLTSQRLNKLDPLLQLAMEVSRQPRVLSEKPAGSGPSTSPAMPHLLETLPQTIDLHLGGAVPTVNVLIKTRDPSALKMPGVNLQAIIGEVVTANVPVNRLGDLARLPGVIYIEASRAQQLYNDLGRADAGAPRAQAEFGVTGRGVIVGVVDTGIDWMHEDFRKPDGTTRIKYLLDFSDPGDPDSDGNLNGDPQYYGGTLYTEADINAALLYNGLAVDSSDTPSAIPDGGATTSEIEVDADVVVNDLVVRMDIAHRWIGDLKVTLRSPASTEVVLHNRTGEGADNIQGSFFPEDFDSENARGVWTLQVEDRIAEIGDTLNAWTLHINQRVREADRDGHGTHVAGSAAGNGLGTGRGYPAGTYAGMAPEATLIVVKASRAEDGFNSSDAANAFRFIDQMAAELGLPYVINYSVGRDSGPHDGTSLDEQVIDVLTGPGQPGKAIVVAAGNAGDRDIHAGGYAAQGGQGELAFEISDERGTVKFDAWYDGAAMFDVGLQYPADGETRCRTRPISGGEWEANCSRLNLLPGDEIREFEIYRPSDGEDVVLNWGSVASTANNSNNGDKNIFFQVFGVAETLRKGTWQVILYNHSSIRARYDAWMLTGPGFKNADASMRVGMPGTARHAITVGAHTTKTTWTDILGQTQSIADLFNDNTVVGDRAPFSSDGPTRDGRLKPELTAPGYMIASTYSWDSPFFPPLVVQDGRHMVLQGTSMAAPHVTGAIALLLEADPNLDAHRIHNLLTSGARGDEFTGARPNYEWGYGKLDVYRALQRLLKGSAVYLPIVLRNATGAALVPTATPSAATATPPTTPTWTPRPTSTARPSPTPMLPQGLVNGDFEEGPTGWTQHSDKGYDLIVSATDLPIDAHGGTWLAWLGGDNDESAFIAQTAPVPPERPYLSYWHWIISRDETCGNDLGGVLIDYGGEEPAVVDGYWLCNATETEGWQQRLVDLTTYAGQTVQLIIVASTDAEAFSSLLVDDVSFQSGAQSREAIPRNLAIPNLQQAKGEISRMLEVVQRLKETR